MELDWINGIVYSVAEPEPPILERLWSWLFGRSELRAGARVAAKIFVFVFSRKFRQIINFAFCKIFVQFREIFAKHEIEIRANIK